MIKIENTEVVGWEAAIRGMRNPMNSWEKSDSRFNVLCKDCGGSYNDGDDECTDMRCDKCYNGFALGPNDHDLLMRLAKGGSVHAKYRRMIVVYVDITAPLYWWKEFDTYKVGTVANSCSTMHKIHDKEFTLEDFSYEHFNRIGTSTLWEVIDTLNAARDIYLKGGNWCGDNFEPKDKEVWWQMIQLLPSSYNQRRTVMLNYEVLAGIYYWRKDHKLDEWRVHETPIEHRDRNKDFSSGMWGFCDWIESLPYSEIITAKPEEKVNIVGWRPISEYDHKNYDWVLVKCFDGYRACNPTVAEMRDDGLWYGEDGMLPFEPRYFFDMQQLDNRESEG